MQWQYKEHGWQFSLDLLYVSYDAYAVCPPKKQSRLLLAQRHQIATKRCNFGHSDLRENCESAYDYAFHLTCVMPIPGKTVSDKLRFGDKQNSQTVKPQIQKFSALT